MSSTSRNEPEHQIPENSELPPTQRFSRHAAYYQKYRPNYPTEAIDYIYDRCALDTRIIADIGSGTGIFTEHFLKRGNTVLAVEPNTEMRKEAVTALTQYPHFVSVAGTAEDTQLSDQSVDCIVCAQAFHWFHAKKTKTEFCRILKDDTTVVLAWNKRDLRIPFLKGLEELLLTHTRNYAEIRQRANTARQETIRQFYQHYDIATFEHADEMDVSALKGRVLSYSYAPHEEAPNYAIFMDQLTELYQKHQHKDKVSFSYETQVIIGTL